MASYITDNTLRWRYSTLLNLLYTENRRGGVAAAAAVVAAAA
jgi:hypothetical protein